MKGKHASVLIVDDEDSLCALLSHLLSPKFQCVIVQSADEAIPLLDSRTFDVVLADIGLPGMSGVELCRYVIERSPATAVIIISGRNVNELTIEAMQAGAFDYITKPFDLSQVQSTVERALNRRVGNEPEEKDLKRTISATNDRSNG